MQPKTKVAFIICSNDKEQCQDCISYIEPLYHPDNFSIEIITIENASGLCEAYNKGMKLSDAAYKVYLHQDTYIINRDFIIDMISCFERHPDAGLLGMIGRKSINKHERLYQAKPFGALYETTINHTRKYYCYSVSKDEKVLHVDGLLMMTRVDIPWRDDLFKGWHMYDVSMSLEMHRAGYSIYIPYMKQPWALHDCGYLSTLDYPVDFEKLLKEYTEFV